MARKMTFLSVVRAMERSARASDAAARRRDTDNRRRERDTERQQRRYEMEQRKSEKEALLQYKEDRKNEAENMTRETANKLISYSKIVLINTQMPQNFFKKMRRSDKFKKEDYKLKQYAPDPFIPNELEINEFAQKQFGTSFKGVSIYRHENFIKNIRKVPKLKFNLRNIFTGKNKIILQAINGEIAKHKALHDVKSEEKREIFDKKELVLQNEFEEKEKQKQSLFEIEKQEHNNKVDKFEEGFFSGNQDFVAEVFETIAQDLIISKVIQDLLEDEQFEDLGDYIDAAFDDNSKTLVINTTLPSQNCIARETEYKYIATRDEITSKAMKDKDFNKLYDSVLAQIVLLYAKLAFNIIPEDVLSCIVVNGYVQGVDYSTGKKLNNCVVSVSILREKFKEIDFEHIDPVQCLKFFKARIASEFINIAPVNPILEFDKNDSRFISAENVIDNFENSTNLATMDWEKFEYLVGDLFGKMFSEHGGEVKITQASRDKGVDAIVFDPDPIRGGKFVIQCKRYNNVVGVSDVRDLWGTIMHEGASKGILVTTSHFGMDSIEWSKDKPITLINGQNLLSLFQKYGYDFKIELQR